MSVPSALYAPNWIGPQRVGTGVCGQTKLHQTTSLPNPRNWMFNKWKCFEGVCACELTSSWPPARVEVGLEGHFLDHFLVANSEGKFRGQITNQIMDKIRSFFKNGNLRFLTHSRDLGAIPPPKWSYGRRAFFCFQKKHQTSSTITKKSSPKHTKNHLI